MTQVQDITSPLTKLERRASYSLASIYALRMFGLFMLIPVLSLFSEQLEGSTPFLIGLTLSIYGLTQALFQIPFGLLSDRFGRKRMITLGLLIFIAGSVMAAMSTDIYGVLAGRALQGCGAIAAAVMALAADLTQEVHRTKIMAMIGTSIGVSFAVSMVLGPIIAIAAGIQAIFWLTAILAFLALIILYFVVPNPLKTSVHPDAESVPSQFKDVLLNADLLRLNFGIFALHLVLMASFVVMPLLLVDAGLDKGLHWQVYLPVMLTSIMVIIPLVILAEKKHKMKGVFISAIIMLSLSFVSLSYYHTELITIIAGLWLFFCGFNLLEATLPSLISKTAPGDMKGTAMGVYSTSQFLGAFIGGSTGGWLFGEYGAGAVFQMCVVLIDCWLLVSISMKTPRYLANLIVSIESFSTAEIEQLSARLLMIEGVAEAKIHYQDQIAYLKVNNAKLNREQLQSLLSENF